MAVQVAVQVPGLGQLRQLVQQLRQLGPSVQQVAGGGVGVARPRIPRQPPSLEKRLLTFIRSTRFAAGGASPLVGRGIDVVAPGASPRAQLAITAVIVGFQAAAGAVRLFKDAVLEGARTLTESSRASILSGGRASQIAGLESMGIPAGDIAALAAGLRASISGGGIAGATANQLGIGPQPGRRFGGANEATGLQAAINAIASLETAHGRFTAARNLELDAILPQIEAFRRNRAAITADAQVRRGIADEGTLRAADDFASAIERLKFSFTSLAQALGKPLLQDLTAAVNVFANLIRDLAAFINANPQLMQPVIQGFRNLLNVLIGGLALLQGKDPAPYIREFNALLDAEKARLQAQDPLVNALNQNTQAQYQLAGVWQQGIHGGGARANSAVPSGLSGRFADMAATNAILRLGVPFV